MDHQWACYYLGGGGGNVGGEALVGARLTGVDAAGAETPLESTPPILVVQFG